MITAAENVQQITLYRWHFGFCFLNYFHLVIWFELHPILLAFDGCFGPLKNILQDRNSKISDLIYFQQLKGFRLIYLGEIFVRLKLSVLFVLIKYTHITHATLRLMPSIGQENALKHEINLKKIAKTAHKGRT